MRALLLAVLAGAMPGGPADGAELPEAVRRGQYVSTAADCEACHTAPGGKPFAGGLPIESPLGTIVATNVTPSRGFGIGTYTLEQFRDVLRRGVRADGAHLYPAMPYASYARMADDDIEDLYAFMMRGVQPVDEKPSRQTALPFPYSLRFSMAFWNALFLDPRPFTPDPARSSAWNRGRYLAESLAHCGECHTQRGFFMQQDRERAYAGAVIGSWFSPNITPDPVAGTGAMSEDEFFRYLKHGRVAGKAQAGGEMGLAVQLSFSRLTDADNRAIVEYLRSVPPVAEGGAKPRYGQGRPVSDVAQFRGVGGTSVGLAPPGGPAQVFAANCASCHGIAGQGSADGYFPSLFHNSALSTGGGRNLVAAILFGVRRQTPDGLAFMPGFGGKPDDIAVLGDAEVAELANHLLNRYGDPALSVSPALVRAVRGGRAPEPLLAVLVTAGEWAAGAVALAGFCWLGFRRFRILGNRRRSA